MQGSLEPVHGAPSCQTPQIQRVDDPTTICRPNQVRPSRRHLPKYLHKRVACFYFKRKIPSDVVEGFPQYCGQIWKALGTELLEKARLLLAVEVTEFELSVAKLRKQKAQLNVGEHVPFGVAGNPGDANPMRAIIARRHEWGNALDLV